MTDAPLSFLGGVDPATGTVIESGHPLHGRSIAGRVLVFPHGKGSTVGSYVLYGLARNGVAPAAIVNEEAETIIAAGALIAGIPLVDPPRAAARGPPRRRRGDRGRGRRRDPGRGSIDF